MPNPEAPEKAVRRRFPAEYKRRILRKAEACKESGHLSTLLRREGLYSSNLTTWRRHAEKGTLEALSSKKRCPLKRRPDPSLRRIAELETKNRKLSHKLKQAELIIEAQKKNRSDTPDTPQPRWRDELMKVTESLAKEVTVRQAVAEILSIVVDDIFFQRILTLSKIKQLLALLCHQRI